MSYRYSKLYPKKTERNSTILPPNSPCGVKDGFSQFIESKFENPFEVVEVVEEVKDDGDDELKRSKNLIELSKQLNANRQKPSNRNSKLEDIEVKNVEINLLDQNNDEETKVDFAKQPKLKIEKQVKSVNKTTENNLLSSKFMSLLI